MLQWTWECRYLFEILFLFTLDIDPGVELLGHMVVLLLISWGTSALFFMVSIPISISISSAQGSLFPLPGLVVTCLFNTSHFKGCKVIDFSLWFLFEFPWRWMMLSKFSCICWPFACLLWETIYSLLLPIFKSSCFLKLSCIIS